MSNEIRNNRNTNWTVRCERMTTDKRNSANDGDNPIIFNVDNNKYEGWDGTEWVSFGPSSGGTGPVVGGGELEKIQGGYGLKGIDRTNRGVLGLNSMDLWSDTDGSGPETDGSFYMGGSSSMGTANGGYGADFMFGYNNQMDTYYNGFVVGQDNTMDGGYSVALIGYGNTYTNNGQNIPGGLAIGLNNAISQYQTYAIGNSLISKSRSTVALGEANVDYSETVGSPERPALVVGNGSVSLSQSNFGTVNFRSDAFIVRHSGIGQLPSQTIQQFEDNTDGKIIVTKEALQSELSGLTGGTTNGNSKAQFYSYSFDSGTDFTDVFVDENIKLSWDSPGNDLSLTMINEPAGGGDLVSFARFNYVNLISTPITQLNFDYDLYPPGVSSGNMVKVNVSAYEDENYPTYTLTLINNGASYNTTLEVKKITKIS